MIEIWWGISFFVNLLLAILYIYNVGNVSPWVRKFGLIVHIPATLIFGALLGTSL